MNWRDKEITKKQKNYIIEMNEHSEYPLPPFIGTTRGQASDYINEYSKMAHESIWGIRNGY